ncbi:hypothetical protein [Yersinia kristensenii]|nr:hypothetical protein [Yersinia kristensenii]
MKTANYVVPGSGNSLPLETPNFNVTEITLVNKVISKSFND